MGRGGGEEKLFSSMLRKQCLREKKYNMDCMFKTVLQDKEKMHRKRWEGNIFHVK